MSRMKDRYMDIVEHAEYCCEFSSSKEEARIHFELVYQDYDHILDQAWETCMMFNEHNLQNELTVY